MGLFRRAPRCPHDRITVTRIFFYLGHSSPTVRGFCVDDGKRVEFQVKGAGEGCPPELLGKALTAMGWRKDGEDTLIRLDTAAVALERHKRETVRLERELGLTPSYNINERN